MQHGFCRFTVSLVIDGHSPVGFYPRKRPFYDPSEGKCHKLESRFLGGPSKSLDKLYQRASIVIIGKELLRQENLSASCFITGITPLKSWMFAG